MAGLQWKFSASIIVATVVLILLQNRKSGGNDEKWESLKAKNSRFEVEICTNITIATSEVKGKQGKCLRLQDEGKDFGQNYFDVISAIAWAGYERRPYCHVKLTNDSSGVSKDIKSLIGDKGVDPGLCNECEIWDASQSMSAYDVDSMFNKCLLRELRDAYVVGIKAAGISDMIGRKPTEDIYVATFIDQKWNFSADDLKTLKSILRHVQAIFMGMGRKAHVHIFSDDQTTDFQQYLRFRRVKFHIVDANKDLRVLYSLTESDAFIATPSAYSYAAALLNNNNMIYYNWKATLDFTPLKEWHAT